ncbi:hypothetical protein E3N88_38360 [Mikania micrantha]|uniref:NGN domain-containing protein n=1 Tax=Mikania micrantha TaxID=192012 RepID=A0A5N6LTU8_9ASTR|nr:hypothetical protein E3N88_38360 [Mikania micrantha]
MNETEVTEIVDDSDEFFDEDYCRREHMQNIPCMEDIKEFKPKKDSLKQVFFEDDFGPEPEPKVKTEPKTPNIPFFPKEEEMNEEDYAFYGGSNNLESQMHGIFVVGFERHSVFCLMQKCVDLKALGTKLQINSTFSVEHVKGFIFIEAVKQCDINEACKGLCNIYPSRVALVPTSEVPHLFSVRIKYNGVSVDTWARVKNGKYKGDLAQFIA